MVKNIVSEVVRLSMLLVIEVSNVIDFDIY